MKPIIKVAIRWSRPAMVAAVGTAVICSTAAFQNVEPYSEIEK